jgi:mono/diheme cytochrome c family protein
MPASSMKIPLSRPAVFFMVGMLAACDSAPGDVREWTAADHEQPDSPQNNVVAPRPRGSAADRGSGDLDLVELAWQRNCTPCHGPRGRGDGPQGPMLRAPDLTRPEWLDKANDQEMLETIRKGRNKMPAFDLPEQVLKGLVLRIRASRQR